MMRNRKNIFAAVFLLLSYVLGFSSANAENIDDKKYVLYLSAYSNSWNSVEHQLAGINETLDDNYIINHEFMDTKNTRYSENYREFYDILKYKLSQREKYDAVIACDDAALLFVMHYKDELFPQTPIVFEGIDNLETARQAEKDPYITGVAEQVDYKKNIELAASLYPEATDLVFIIDNAENSVGIKQQLFNHLDYFSKYIISYIDSSKCTTEELCQKLAALDENTITFCISMGQNNSGGVYTEEERYEILNTFVHVPMFRVSSSGVGYGMLGGYIIDHKRSASLAAQMLSEYFNGADFSAIPVEYTTPKMYYFDKNVMDKYGIKKSQLPEDSEIINYTSFVAAHGKAVIVVLASALLLLAAMLMIWMTRSLKKQKRYNAELKRFAESMSEANNAKSDFLSRMSHDIRTPMNVIVGMSALAEKEAESDTVKDYLDKISSSSKYLLGLLNDILDSAKIDSNTLELHNEPYEYDEFIENMTNMIEPLCKAKNITLEMNPQPGPTIIVDKLRFQQIFFNIFTNAVKYTPEGGKIVHFTEARVLDDGRLDCYCHIVDNGIGMSEEFVKKIGEPFMRENQSGYEFEQGTGLGLSITKRLLDMMGGELIVKSELGRGTEMIVHTTLTIASSSSEKSEKSASPESYDLKGRHILLCEDHPLNTEIAKKLLEREGMLVDCASNGKQGAEMFEASEPDFYDAILMDIHMPIMDGFEATKKIRAMKRADAATVPIIALTANVFEDDKEKSRASGMNEHIAKPVEPENMYKTIQHCINESKRKK